MNAITLTAAQAERFGLVKKAKKDFYDLMILDVLLGDATTTAVVSLEGIEQKITLNHVVDPQEDIRFLLAWCCLEFFDFDFERNGALIRKQRAKELMGNASNFFHRDSCIAAYIFHRYDLENRGDDALYLRHFRHAPDTFPDFYRLIWASDSNKIRAAAILKEGLRKFPFDIRMVLDLASYYFSRGKYEECLTTVSGIVPESQPQDWGHGVGCVSLKCQVFIRLGKYAEATQVVDKWAIEPSFKSFFYGLISYHQGMFEEASKHFRACMESCPEDEVVEASGYFLIDCHLKTKEYQDALAIFEYLPLSRSTNFFIPYFEFTFADQAEKVTRAVLSKAKDEKEVAALHGRLAYILRCRHFHDDEDFDSRKLLKREFDILKEALMGLHKAIKAYPYSAFYHAECSRLSLLARKYDDAKKQSVMACMLDAKFSDSKPLNKCSSRFIKNYALLISNLADQRSFSFEGYASYSLENDIDQLYELKEYEQIAQLADLFEREGYTANRERYLDRALFMIAYSYNKCGNSGQGKKYYQYLSSIGKESSGSLNNLALIHEKEGNMKLARKCIEEAKQKLGDREDEMIERNYQRIMANTPKTSDKSPEPIRPPEKSLPSFDIKEGDILIGGIKIHIASHGDYQHHVCHTLFTQKNIGDWVDFEDLQDSYSSGKAPKSPRWIKDAIHNINKKVREKAPINYFLRSTGAKVRIDPALLV